MAKSLILRVFFRKQELIKNTSRHKDSFTQAHRQSIDIVRVIFFVLLHLFKDDFILLITHIEECTLPAFMDSVVGRIGKAILSVPPLVKDLVHMSIIHKLFYEYIHLQGFKLRFTKESVLIFIAVVICKEFFRQIIVS